MPARIKSNNHSRGVRALSAACSHLCQSRRILECGYENQTSTTLLRSAVFLHSSIFGLITPRRATQFIHRAAEFVRAAEQFGDVADLSVVRHGRDFEHVGQHKLRGAVLGVFLQQFVENLPRLGSVLFEEIFALAAQALRAFTAGAQRRVEREMAEQISSTLTELARMSPPTGGKT